MSSGTGSHTTSRAIPTSHPVIINDVALMPQEYSTTPEGTLFSTTPGGTRIIYDRKFLLECRTSPLTRTPPCLPDIPGVTSPLSDNTTTDTAHPKQTPNNLSPPADKSAGEDAQFEMDI
ncbi:eukaryotic translation initiation factor 4E-binding protein 1 [Coregonus clupeaformis]|uniref:eukaryotic translation initiation factor 4E-binding protein 1 n=1 Tax=Coregonus clupeaformis TaxID=59861 RepID=UPI001BDFD398|nr:eukaryotic translation initiation factor 4E-binding protein 1 [Coregonus clupeaformis]